MGEVVAGTVNSAPSPSSPTRGPGGKAGTRQPRGEHDLFIGLSDQLPMPTMDSSEKALEVWIKEYYKTDQLKQAQDKAEEDRDQVSTNGPDTNQKYLRLRRRFKNSKVMEYTGQQVQRHENITKPASEMFVNSAFFGWCIDYQGTNADNNVPTTDSQVNSNIMGYVRSHQLDGRHHHLGADRGHLLRDGYWVKQQADHAFHQGDPLQDTRGQQELPGGQDHQVEPHGRAHVQWVG